MEAKKIKVVKDWPKPKSVCNIQIFLNFANFYQQFIQDFTKVAVPLIAMVKTIKSPDKLVLSKNNSSRSAFSKNENSKLASEKNNINNKVNGLSVDDVEYAKKSKKLKSQNLAKFRKLFKLEKSKSEKSKNCQKVGIHLIYML